MTPTGNLPGMGGSSQGANLYNTISSAASSAPSQNTSQAPQQSSPAEETLQLGSQMLENFKSFTEQFPGIAEEERTSAVQAIGRYFEKVVGHMGQANSPQMGMPSGVGGGESGY